MHREQNSQEVVLLLGGAGFIGAHVAKQLIADGHHVVIYDSFVQYISPLLTRYNEFLKKRFEGLESATVVRGDTRDVNLLARVLDEYRPSRIVNFACLPMAELSSDHVEETYSGALTGHVNVLELLRRREIERYLYISSSMVYGDFKCIPCDEDQPKAPKDLYGAFKYSGEIITETYGRRHDIPYSIVRPSSVYGPTDCNMRVFQIFIEKALRGERFIIQNSGRLDFTFVEDTAQGIAKVLFSPKGQGEVFNITYGRSRSLDEAAEIMKRLLPEVNVGYLMNDDKNRPMRGTLNVDKARELVDYRPRFSLEEGLKKYVEFYTAL